MGIIRKYNRSEDWYYLTVQEGINSNDFPRKSDVHESWTKFADNPDGNPIWISGTKKKWERNFTEENELWHAVSEEKRFCYLYCMVWNKDAFCFMKLWKEGGNINYFAYLSCQESYIMLQYRNVYSHIVWMMRMYVFNDIYGQIYYYMDLKSFCASMKCVYWGIFVMSEWLIIQNCERSV